MTATTPTTPTTQTRGLRERTLRSLGQLPPFSPILNRLLASLAREDVSFIEIGELIEKDTVLAGNVLHLVNSALYGHRATVNSVRHAVSLLGITKLRNATLGMSVTRMWSQATTPQGWSMARFNLHSVATAMLADGLSQNSRVEYAEGAFAAGLFHDLGRLLIAVGLPEEYKRIAKLHLEGRGSRPECEEEVLGFTHADLSADALAHWNLPVAIRAAVQFHERPDLALPCDGHISLSRVIGAADRYVNAAGYYMDSGRNPSIEDARQGMAELDPSRPLQPLLDSFATEIESAQALF